MPQACQYAVGLPRGLLSSLAGAKAIGKIKRFRKTLGILDIKCLIFNNRRCRFLWLWRLAEFSDFLIVLADNATSAWKVIVALDNILSRTTAVHVDKVFQKLMPSQARYIFLHATPLLIKQSCITFQVDADEYYNEAGVVTYSREHGLALAWAIHNVFSRNKAASDSAKQLVWKFLGGKMHMMGSEMKYVADALARTVVHVMPFFDYGVLLSIKWPHQRLSVFEAVEARMKLDYPTKKIALWVKAIDYYSPHACNISICGIESHVQSAVEILWQVRKNGECQCCDEDQGLEIREAYRVQTGEFQKTLCKKHWEQQFGLTDWEKHANVIADIAGPSELDSLIQISSSCGGKGYGKGGGWMSLPQSRKDLKDLMSPHSILVVDCRTEALCYTDSSTQFRVGFAVLGKKCVVEKLIQRSSEKMLHEGEHDRMRMDIAKLRAETASIKAELASASLGQMRRELEHLKLENAALKAELASNYQERCILAERVLALEVEQHQRFRVGDQVEVWWNGRWWPALISADPQGGQYCLRDVEQRWHSWRASGNVLRKPNQSLRSYNA